MCTCRSTYNYNACSMSTMCLTQLHILIQKEMHTWQQEDAQQHVRLLAYRASETHTHCVSCHFTYIQTRTKKYHNLSCTNIKDLQVCQDLVTQGSCLAGEGKTLGAGGDIPLRIRIQIIQHLPAWANWANGNQ